MDIETAFVNYLLSKPNITALIERRLHPDETPKDVDLNKQTAVIYQHVSSGFVHTHDGQDKTELPNYQFTAYAPKRPQVKAIAKAFKTALCDFTGNMSGLNIQGITLINELYDTIHPVEGLTVSSCDMEFQIIYDRSD